MKRLNIHEAKTHLSRYLSDVENGETVILCRRNVPIAEIRPLPKPGNGPRPLGLGKGFMTISEEFYEPLPDELLDAFEGKTGSGDR